jgi:hypothetical protein
LTADYLIVCIKGFTENPEAYKNKDLMELKTYLWEWIENILILEKNYLKNPAT